MRPPFATLAASLLCAALTAGCIHFPVRKPPPGVSRYGLYGWTLVARTDPFTRETACRLDNGSGRDSGAEVRRGAFAFRFADRIGAPDPSFRFSHPIDTSDAWFRIDNGPPQAWRDVVPHLIDTGAMSQAERLDNPSGGVMLVPRDMLANARLIVIRPAKGVHPRLFDLEGAWPLLRQADVLHCRFG